MKLQQFSVRCQTAWQCLGLRADVRHNWPISSQFKRLLMLPEWLLKLCFFRQAMVTASLCLGLPLLAVAYQEAPVEDLSVNSIYLHSAAPASAEGSSSPADNLSAVAGSSLPAGGGRPSSEYGDFHHPAYAAPESTDSSPPVMPVMAQSIPANRIASGSDRVSRLEQQVSNIVSMNVPQQLSQLQRAIQQLNGRLQIEEHELQMLKTQQRSFYEDLNRRLPKAATSSGANVASKVSVNAVPSVLHVGKVASSGQRSSQAFAHKDNAADALAYHRAFKMLVDKNYEEAIVAFNDYIARYSSSVFIANAYYWLGELYLRKGNIERATRAFNQIMMQYPESNKVPDAKLKLAIIHAHNGQPSMARREFIAIKRQYPGSTAAQLANIQLQTMSLQS